MFNASGALAIKLDLLIDVALCIWELGSLFGPAPIIKTRRSPVGCRRHLASSIIVVSVLIVQQKPFYDYVHVCKHFVQPGWSPQPSCWRPTGASAMASGRCSAWTWFLFWKIHIRIIESLKQGKSNVNKNAFMRKTVPSLIPNKLSS